MRRARSTAALAILLATTLSPLHLAGADVSSTSSPTIKVNFQPAGAPVPAGHVVDSGHAFDTTRGYGWVAQTSSTPTSMIGQAFDRGATTDQRLDTVTHMHTRWHKVDGRWTGTVDPARWEHTLPNGTYDITVTAGDAANPDGTHTITVEGTTAIDRFTPTPTTRHTTKTIRTTITDGRLTLDGATGTNTKLNAVEITPVTAPTTAKINFQPAGTTTPTGSTPDTGRAYDTTRGYGWIAATSTTPKSLEGQAFTRNASTDPRLDSLINVTERWTQVNGRWTSTTDPARWEHTVTNGTYDVTVTVGDAANADGVHTINVEGTTAIDRFTPTTTTRHATKTVRTTVTDGRLTLDATGGTNTKLNHVDITPATTTTPPPSPTTTTPPPSTTIPPTTTTTTVPPATTTTTAPKAPLVATANKEANAETRRTLDFLATEVGARTGRALSGQHVGNTANIDLAGVNAIRQQTGEVVGLLGADLGAGGSSDKLVKTLTDHHDAGGIVEISIHAKNPMTGGPYADLQVDIGRLTTPGTDEHKRWHRQLDGYAAALQALEDNGVPVILRPLHEMNCSSFWWSFRNPTMTIERYRLLWRQMFSYLNEAKGLDNLLWAFTPHISNMDGRQASAWYPGDAYVDLVGLDVYKARYDPTTLGKIKGFRQSLTQKPFVLGEVGPDRSISTPWDLHVLRDALEDHLPFTSYFMTWSGGRLGMENLRNAPSFLRGDRVVNRSDLSI